MANQERLKNQPTNHSLTRRRFLVGTATVLAGGAGFLAANIFRNRTPIVPEPSSVAGAQEATTPTAAPTTDIPIPTATTKPANTATSIVTPTEAATATATVKPVDTPTATATPTEKPKLIEKSPLPKYGVFSGDLLKEDGSKDGMVVIISTPQETGPDQLVVIGVNNLQPGKTYSNIAFPADLQFVEGTNFKAECPLVPPRVMRAGDFTIEGVLDESGRLSGKIENKTGPADQLRVVWSLRFKASSVGNGRDKAIEAVKKMKVNTGKYPNANWTQILVDEFIGKPYIKLP